jgi:hypothetical protein
MELKWCSHTEATSEHCYLPVKILRVLARIIILRRVVILGRVVILIVYILDSDWEWSGAAGRNLSSGFAFEF